MVRKIGLAFLCLGTAFFACIIGVQFYSSNFDVGAVNARMVMAFLTGVIAIGRMLTNRPQYTFRVAVLEKEHAHTLKDVFLENKKARKKLMKAIVQYNENKFRDAINILTELLKSCETNNDLAAVHLFLALCYDDQELWKQSLEHYVQVIRHDTTNDTAHSNAGLIYKKMGNFNDAIDCYKKAIAINPGNAFAYNNIAGTYLNMLDADSAIESALKTLEIKSNMYQAMNTLALAYSFKNDKESAEKYYQLSVVNGCPNASHLRMMMSQMTSQYQKIQDEDDSE